MIKKSSFLPFPTKIFTLTVDIIILNPIGPFKVDFDYVCVCVCPILPQNSPNEMPSLIWIFIHLF
jgi:hypothetical protein